MIDPDAKTNLLAQRYDLPETEKPPLPPSMQLKAAMIAAGALSLLAIYTASLTVYNPHAIKILHEVFKSGAFIYLIGTSIISVSLLKDLKDRKEKIIELNKTI